MSETRKNRTRNTPSATGRPFIGQSKDGIEIARPVVKPRSFTVQQLRRVMRDVLREQAVRQAG